MLGTQSAPSNPQGDSVPGWISQACVGIQHRSNSSLLPLTHVSHTTVNKTHQPLCRNMLCHLRSLMTILVTFFFSWSFAIFHKRACAGVLRGNFVEQYITELAAMRQQWQQFAPFVSAEYKTWTFAYGLSQ